MSVVTISSATADQLAELVAFAALSPDAPHWPVMAWQSFLLLPKPGTAVQRSLFALRCEEEIAGVIAVALLGNVTELELLLVKPECRRSGLGRALTMYWCDWARAAGANEAVLEVRASNYAAQALYQMLGFVVQGVRKRYYTDPVEDALLLHCRLQ